MFIRAMTPEDLPELTEMLELEDEGDGAILLGPHNTFIFDDNGISGFFMMKIEQNLPSLRYFIVKREKRSVKYSRKTVRAFKKFIRDLGFPATLVVVKKDYLRRFVEYHSKRKPYADENGMSYYLVEV